jgi:hypothetical protein
MTTNMSEFEIGPAWLLLVILAAFVIRLLDASHVRACGFVPFTRALVDSVPDRPARCGWPPGLRDSFHHDSRRRASTQLA